MVAVKRDKAARHRAILIVLRDNQPLTEKELRQAVAAAGFQFGERTWQRDMRAMFDDGSLQLCVNNDALELRADIV